MSHEALSGHTCKSSFLLAYWRGPISEDARRLLGREQRAAGESTGTCGVMANHTKSITQSLFAGSADLRSFLAQESSQVAAFVSAGFDAVLGD